MHIGKVTTLLVTSYTAACASVVFSAERDDGVPADQPTQVRADITHDELKKSIHSMVTLRINLNNDDGVKKVVFEDPTNLGQALTSPTHKGRRVIVHNRDHEGLQFGPVSNMIRNCKLVSDLVDPECSTKIVLHEITPREVTIHMTASALESAPHFFGNLKTMMVRPAVLEAISTDTLPRCTRGLEFLSNDRIPSFDPRIHSTSTSSWSLPPRFPTNPIPSPFPSTSSGGSTEIQEPTIFSTTPIPTFTPSTATTSTTKSSVPPMQNPPFFSTTPIPNYTPTTRPKSTTASSVTPMSNPPFFSTTPIPSFIPSTRISSSSSTSSVTPLQNPPFFSSTLIPNFTPTTTSATQTSDTSTETEGRTLRAKPRSISDSFPSLRKKTPRSVAIAGAIRNLLALKIAQREIDAALSTDCSSTISAVEPTSAPAATSSTDTQNPLFFHTTPIPNFTPTTFKTSITAAGPDSPSVSNAPEIRDNLNEVVQNEEGVT